MLVADLHCEHGHVFEGWFASADDLQSQKQRGLLHCPMCASDKVERRPSASRLNVSALRAEKAHGHRSASVTARAADAQASRSDDPAKARADAAHETDSAAQAAEAMAAMQAMYLQAVRHVLANTEDVGDRFVDEVRSIHRGDAPERPVRGSADRDEVAELKEEGIDVVSMPLPAALKGPLQ